jgi:hypothetical protein
MTNICVGNLDFTASEDGFRSLQNLDCAARLF